MLFLYVGLCWTCISLKPLKTKSWEWIKPILANKLFNKFLLIEYRLPISLPIILFSQFSYLFLLPRSLHTLWSSPGILFSLKRTEYLWLSKSVECQSISNMDLVGANKAKHQGLGVCCKLVSFWKKSISFLIVTSRLQVKLHLMVDILSYKT